MALGSPGGPSHYRTSKTFLPAALGQCSLELGLISESQVGAWGHSFHQLSRIVIERTLVHKSTAAWQVWCSPSGIY